MGCLFSLKGTIDLGYWCYVIPTHAMLPILVYGIW